MTPLLGPVQRTEALVVESAGIGTALYLRSTRRGRERERDCVCVREREEGMVKAEKKVTEKDNE